MKKTLLISLLFLFSIVLSAVITVYVIDTSDTPDTYDSYKIASKILSEEREIIVKTPRGYNGDGTTHYPVVYIFGGNSLTYSVANDLDLLIRTAYFKPIIVVGAPNISQKTRQRDLTPPFLKQDLDEVDSPLGKADQYLDFVQTEVIPLIGKNYHTSSERIAVGHSREGLMVMYSLMEKPELFNGHLALSPALWRENNLFTKVFSDFIQDNDTIPSRLFLTMGDLEVEKMKNAFDTTINILDKNSSKVIFKGIYFPQANHSSNPFLTAPIGLDWILKN